MNRKLQALRDALETDHCYGNCSNTCDIHAAFEEGLYLWAANLLIGATECDATEAAFNELEPTEEELEEERRFLIELPNVRCKVCGSHCYTDVAGDVCDNCNTALTCNETYTYVARKHERFGGRVQFEHPAELPCTKSYKHYGPCVAANGIEFGDEVPELCLNPSPEHNPQPCVLDKNHEGLCQTEDSFYWKDEDE